MPLLRAALAAAGFPAGEALGRSRGRLATKQHLACDGKGRPLSVVLTPGRRPDSTLLEPVLDAVRVPRPGGAGRPRKRPDRLIADEGYGSERCRRRARPRGRKPAFDKETYRRRTVVERYVNRLKRWRGVATRFKKRAANLWAMVVVSSLMIRLDQ